MGKLKGGGNTKAEAANARKDAVKASKDAAKAAEIAAEEAKEWAMGANARGANRAELEAAKLAEKQRKAAEKKLLEQEEEASLSAIKQAPRKTKKQKDMDKPWELALAADGAKKKNNRGGSQMAVSAASAGVSESKAAATNDVGEKMKAAGIVEPSKELMENRNREFNMEEVATSIDEALDLLGNKSDALEKHPERRAKAAYKAFEERKLAELKEEYPGLKLSQYKQKLSDLWRRSPENPLNQQSLAYNAKKN